MLSRPCVVVALCAVGLGCRPSSPAQVTAAPLLSAVRGPPAPAPVAATPQPTEEEGAVDRIFADMKGTDRPGCAVGVARDGRTVLTRAYGVANLEDGTPNTPESIFEAGSVSKQFTAAAVVLLAQQGKLSLDDDVHRYVPELPVYAKAITLRQMLNHTSGLRDWAAVEDVAGWPRGTRAYSQAFVLDVARHQRALNFTPGTFWGYSNSNYNLAAIVVQRVSGTSFAEFTRQYMFAPLGMTHTRWRDDYTRVIPGRSTPYALGKDHAWHFDSPIENAIGNGGLLTTVADLLRWNENFVHPTVGGAALVSTLEAPGALEGGRTDLYGMGLCLDKLDGMRSFAHWGKTAGYTSYLQRLPDEGLSVAILCNVGGAPVYSLTRNVVKALRAHAATPAPEPSRDAVSALPVVPTAGISGLYRSEVTGMPVAVTMDGLSLKVGRATADLDEAADTYAAVTATRFETRGGGSIDVIGLPATTGASAPTRLRVTIWVGTSVDVARVTAWQPDLRALEALQGEYVSEEADARLTACVRDGKLVLLQGPERVVALEPSYADVLTGTNDGGEWMVTVRRAGGRVAGLDIGMGRMWRLPFTRTGARVCGEKASTGTASR